jgi:hypothetical protein
MSKLWVWPRCTYPDCDCRRTWKTERQAHSAYERHPGWTRGTRAICYCHGLEEGATFPCDLTQQVTHSV